MAVYTVDSLFLASQEIIDLTTISNHVALEANFPDSRPTPQVFLNIQHAFEADLAIALTNPDGTSGVLCTEGGAATDEIAAPTCGVLPFLVLTGDALNSFPVHRS